MLRAKYLAYGTQPAPPSGSAPLIAACDERGDPPQWNFTCAELGVLAAFYRRCAERGFAVYADV